MRYVFDPRRSRFTVQAFAGGMLAALGHSPVIAVRDFTGELSFAPETWQEASFQMTVKADSLAPTDAVNARDRPEIESRMRQEVLEAAADPEIGYRAAVVSADRIAENWYRLRLQGDLSLHGVAHPLAVDAQAMFMDDGARLSGEFPLLLSAFRIKRVSALAGAITVKDELKCTFDLMGGKEGA